MHWIARWIRMSRSGELSWLITRGKWKHAASLIPFRRR
jgi:hypothetical protein